MHTLTLQSDDDPASISIARYRIHCNSEPVVIAEAGVNHEGQLDHALRLVDAAQQAGAQAVKFQIFSADALATAQAPAAPYQTAAGCSRSQRDMLAALQFTRVQFERLKDHCAHAGLLFLATPFAVDDLRTLLELGVPAIKIASTDLNHIPLIDAAIAANKPVLLSTGASTLSEIDEAVSHFDQHEACERLILLHCVSSYPTSREQAALANIAYLRERYRLWTGYSDHTEAIETAGLAVACGARLLEKHLTLDRSLGGPDHAFSLTPEMFRAYVDCAREAWQMMGTPREGVYGAELDVRAVARRSVVSTTTIHKGDLITSDMLALKRPGGGIEPQDLPKLIGSRATREIPTDAQIEWSMVS